MAALRDLLARSRRRSTEHLRSIVDDDRALSAAEVVAALGGMKVVSLATVTARGEPRISAVDGHFLHGTWLWGTSGTSAKARHLAARPAVSVAHVDGEALAVFAHGTARRLERPDGRFGEAVAYLTGHYGMSPLGLGPDIRLYRHPVDGAGRCHPTHRIPVPAGAVAPRPVPPGPVPGRLLPAGAGRPARGPRAERLLQVIGRLRRRSPPLLHDGLADEHATPADEHARWPGDERVGPRRRLTAEGALEQVAVAVVVVVHVPRSPS